VHTRDVWRVVVRSAVVGTQHIKIASNAIQYVEGCPSDFRWQCPNNRQPDNQVKQETHLHTQLGWSWRGCITLDCIACIV